VSVALVIQNALRLRSITLLSVACLPVQNFSPLSYKRHNFWRKLLNFNLLVTRCINNFNIQQLYVLPKLYLCVVYTVTCATDWSYNRDEKYLQRGTDWAFK
jgi:hypothetical protein